MADKIYISQVPELMLDWFWEKNDAEDIFPDRISSGSDKKAYWKCHVCGHEEFKRCNNRYYGHTCVKCNKAHGGKTRTNTVIDANGSFADLCPELAKEWHPTRNGNLTPHMVNRGCSKKVWWLCEKGHEYSCAISHRTSGGNGCPYCAGKKAWPGFNDLETLLPDIARQWHPIKNSAKKPSEVTVGSNKKVWWLCEKGHEYEGIISNRTNGGGCPYCAGKKVLMGFNDLQSQSPETALYWDWERNGELTPEQVTAGSQKNCHWLCPKCDYRWTQAVYARNGRQCPACANHVLHRGYNDLATVYPKIAAQWHPFKNGEGTPSDVISGTNSKHWWKCEVCGHEWKASVYSRIHDRGCEVCSRIKRGRNRTRNLAQQKGSLRQSHPELMKEWNFERDTHISPDEIHAGYGKKVWWRCSQCHREWEASVYSRAKGNGCQRCNDSSHTSFAEQAICYYLSQITTVENRKHIYKTEIDVYLPALDAGVEYDGLHWHKHRRKRDEEKAQMLREKGVRLIRVLEDERDIAIGDTIHYRTKDQHAALGPVIKQIAELLGLPKPDVDIKRDRTKIQAQYLIRKRRNSLEEICPAVAAEWDYEKNYPLTPSQVSYGSKKVYWWKCAAGHEWEASVCDRATRNGGRGCGICSGNRRDSKYDKENSLAKVAPKVAAEWDHEKNDPLTPEKISYGSNREVWWKCANGHEWKASVKSRVGKRGGYGCGYCSGNRKLIAVEFE